MLSEKKFLNESKNHNPPPLQVKWSVPYGIYTLKSFGSKLFTIVTMITIVYLLLDLQLPMPSVLSPLMLWIQISIRRRCTTLCDKVCQWLATGRWFSPGPPVSSTNKTDCHDITEILLKVALNTTKQTNKLIGRWFLFVLSWFQKL